MSTAVQYRAKYDFVASGKGMLSFKLGDQFSLVSKTSDSWWTVKSAAGDMGLAPANYLQPAPVCSSGGCVCVSVSVVT